LADAGGLLTMTGVICAGRVTSGAGSVTTTGVVAGSRGIACHGSRRVWPSVPRA
jgi:hypothetical protein